MTVSVFDSTETRTVGPDEGPGEETTRELEPGARVYQYEILAELGRGGMGVVYSAQDHDLGRQIALKILRTRTSRSGQDISIRLKREAQALAQLSHPNVVQVYEVGDFEGSVFLAMELVRGPNVRDWLEDTKPDRRAILDVFAQAGHGLAAAHAADLIHRDFKPDNVIVGDDGRVRVLDFGLARANRPDNLTTGEHASPDSDRSGVTRESLDTPMALDTPGLGLDDATNTNERFGAASLLHAQLTRYGGVQGTPAYMSPEQFLSEAVDSRADQYAYSTALFEALCGYRPVKASNISSLRRRVIRGKYEPFLAEARIPRHIQRALLRGLTRDPDERFPDMQSLVAELVRDPVARVRRIVLLATLAVLIAAVTWFLASRRDETEPPCARVAERIDLVWNEAARSRIKGSFLSASRSYGEETASLTSAVLDDYARAWTDMRVDTCEATHVRAEQSESLFDLSMRCLDGRLTHLRAFIDLVSGKPTPEVVNEAVQAAHELPALEQCADAEALNAAMPRPNDPDKLEKLTGLEKRLATATVQMNAGRHKEALTAAEDILNDSRALDFPPQSALAGYTMGILAEKNSEPERAEKILLESARLAAQAGDDELSARIWIAMLDSVGHSLGKVTDAGWVARMADIALVRSGNKPLMRARLDSYLGSAAYAAGQTAEAYARHVKALETRRSHLDQNHPEVVESLTNVGATLYVQGRFEEAADINRAALRAGAKTLGEQHPDMAIAHLNLAVALVGLGEYESASRHYQNGLRINQAAYGEGHILSSYLLINIGELAWLRGRHERAREAYAKALRNIEKVVGEEHLHLAYPLTGLGQALLGLDQPDEALRFLTRAKELREAGKADSAEQAITAFYLQRALWASGQQTPKVRALASAAYEQYRNGASHLRAEAGIMKAWLDSLPTIPAP